MNVAAPICDIKRFAVHDGPGIRTTVFLQGCPLRCVWCHNPESWSVRPELAFYADKCVGCGACVAVCPTGAHALRGAGHVFDRSRCDGCGACADACLYDALRRYGAERTTAEVWRTVLADRTFYEQSGGGVTVSGGEPLLWPAWVADLFGLSRAEGIATAVDTCGDVAFAAFEAVMPSTDLFLYDLKHMDSPAHEKLTGRPNGRILDNVRSLSAAGARIEIRIPLVPGGNDADADLEAMGCFLGPLRIERVKVLPYHALARSKYASLGLADRMPRTEPPAPARLARAKSLLEKHGLRVVAGRE